jgi:hypothetical protein
VLDAAEASVELMPGLEMRPLKSATEVIGVGADLATAGTVCDHCSLRDTCRHRIVLERVG